MTSETEFQTYESGCVVRNYRELQFNNFAIDSSSERIAATIQKSIAILDLENPEGPQPLRKLGRQNKYDIRVLEWNPSETNGNLLASTSQNKLDIWDAVTSRDPLNSVKAHTRAVSDLNWSYSDSNCIASCSVDSYVYTWDVRDLRKPKLSFKAVAGASCVRWNRLDSHTLASAHDSDVRIWDSRNPSTAVGYISAHVNKIYGLDWSYLSNKGLTTWSQDASVKFWNISTPREPVHVLKGYARPVWKALNTPFGHGLALSLAQHIHGSGDERVFLQNFSDLITPLHIFTGHTDSILDIQWRANDKYNNYSLISWSRDYTLRIWDITPAMKEGCVQSNDEEKTKSPPPSTIPITKPKVDITSEYSPSTPSDSVFSQQPVQTLEQEFSLLNLDIPNLDMEQLEASQRSCTVKIHNDSQLVRLIITFPSHYPNAAPGFIVDTATNIDTSQQQELIQKLQDSAQSFMKQGKPCLQHCIKLLANTLQLFSARPAPPVTKPNVYDLTTLQDDNIPFARTSGARFCSCGILVVFNRPRGLVLPTMEGKKTPRSMSMYKVHIRNQGTYVSQTTSINNKLQVPSANWRSKKHQSMVPYVIKEPHRKLSKNPYVGLVMVMDTSSLLPVNRDLANNYVLQAKNIEEMCQQNAAVALSAGRTDLVKTWSIAAMVANTSERVAASPDDDEAPWPIHPFARPLIQSLFSYYTKIYDIQTLAMLSCVFQAYDNTMATAMGVDDDGPNGFTIVVQQSKIGSPKHNHDFGDFENPEEEEMAQHKINCRLLDHHLTNQCNEMVRCYSNVLYCWRMFSLRAELLSFNATKDKEQTTIGFLNHCNKCIHPVNTPSCDFCKALSLSCSICHVAVKGISSFCPQCCHGGHLFHMLDWFDKNSECPSGCGCNCSRVSYVTQNSN
ncbi:GATOR2 complex protein WDR59-like [Dysidea avara]|uniref:GATOR2 complex protein WDR59-like n=1 Tax=Dysidea avara TaxID=196820 RepID=UPI00332AF7DD